MEASPAPRYFIRLHPRLGLILAALVLLLLVVHLAVAVIHFRVHEVNPFVRDLFDVDQEKNLPTWFSEATLLLTCGLLLAITSAKRREKDPQALLWLGLTLIFGCVALDEDASLHETLNNLLHRDFHAQWLSWVIPALALLTVFGVVYIRFWWKLPPRTRLLFAIAGVMFVGGAAGVDYIKNWFVENQQTLGYAFLSAGEKFLQLNGEALFVHALVTYMRDAD